jgi:hypothetical protein
VAPERVISTVDPEARHAHKTRAHHQDGYKAHVKVEPDTGIITGCALTPAAGPEHSDAAVGIELLADEPDPVAVLADSAYGTGELLDTLEQAGHTAIIKPWPLRPAVDGGFTLDEFTVDEAAGMVTCPNGLTARITRTRTATFGARCRDCPLRARCTSSPRGRKLALHPHDALQRAHRARAQDPEFQAAYRRHRPMVERSISWLVAGRNRRLRFRGTSRNDLWLHHRAAALNLRRLLALGLIRSGGTWTLAPA